MSYKFKIEKVGDTELPPQTGTYDYNAVDVKALPKTAAKVSSNVIYTLENLRSDGLCFYHPGMLLRAGYDPVRACWAENGWDLKDVPYRVPLPKSVFIGATPPEDTAVYACIPEKFGDLCRFLDRIRFAGQIPGMNDMVWDSARQVISVLDPIVPDKLPATLIPIHVWGLEGPTEALLWQPMKSLKRPRQYQLTRLFPKPKFNLKSLDFT